MKPAWRRDYGSERVLKAMLWLLLMGLAIFLAVANTPKGKW